MTVLPTPVAPRIGYWQAEHLAEASLREFRAAQERADPHGQRAAFYLVAWYHHRTLHILNRALAAHHEPLAQTALHNVLTLHRALLYMHRAAPEVVPVVMALGADDRAEFTRDIVARVLSEGAGALSLAAIAERVNHLDILGDVAEPTVRRHLETLIHSGHVVCHDGRYRRTSRPYADLDHDQLGLRALVGPPLYAELSGLGFAGLRDVDRAPDVFCATFAARAGASDPATGQLLLDAIAALLAPGSAEGAIWPHDDLLQSPHPRPYQRESFAVLRRRGYEGLVVDAPAGSGKTLIGMLCIEDWLRSLHQGQSVLVLVPTSNYQQQWTRELCSIAVGLRLSPDAVFSGTPAEFERWRHRTGQHPPVLLMTYASLAQLGSAAGKGGFDSVSVEMFLQTAAIQYVILDEVHKVAENRRGVSGDVIRLLVEWLRDTSLRGLVGFSATAAAYREPLAALGLKLAHTVPLDDLVAAGFVAPFAEFGVTFGDSTRERVIRDLLSRYKGAMLAFFALLGAERLRREFAALPAEDRLHLGHDLLGMYRGRRDWREALERRFAAWVASAAEPLRAADWPLVTIVQLARGWSDGDLARETECAAGRFAELVTELATLRRELRELIREPRLEVRLAQPGFAETLDAAAVRGLYGAVRDLSDRVEQVKDALAVSIAGLHGGLREWYFHTGEGRVETIKAIVSAERSVRGVSGSIVYDRGRHIRWRVGVPAPGYAGAGGLFAQLLGDSRFIPLAVLSNEIYLPHDEREPLPARIASYIESVLLRTETAAAIFALTIEGLVLPPTAVDRLRQQFEALLTAHLAAMSPLDRPLPREFGRQVLRPLRQRIRGLRLGVEGKRLRTRLNVRNPHLARLIQEFIDYALLAQSFRHARVAELEQAPGVRRRYCVVPMPGVAHRRRLLYDLTARLVDDASLPFDVLVVSNWARTGWNVVRPNLLIDATATRSVIAWQQLRGRALRAPRTWTSDCYHLMASLSGEEGSLGVETEGAGVDLPSTLDQSPRHLLQAVAPADLRPRLEQSGLAELSPADRRRLAVALLLDRNKTTHVYELVKAIGDSSQVRYDRRGKVWCRRETIARKHHRMVAIDPWTGRKTRGEAGAPLIYAQDPRTDLPGALQARLTEVLTGRDNVIVDGWLDRERFPEQRPRNRPKGTGWSA